MSEIHDVRLSRRRLLQLAAAGLPVAAGLGRFASTPRAIAAGPIVKPLPPEWFIPIGTNQPRTVPFNDGGYLFWAAVRHPVQVA